jgi:hypothetical protein
VSRRTHHQFLTLMLLEHAGGLDQIVNHDRTNRTSTAQLDQFSLTITGPTAMAAMDIFGQWFTVTLRNEGGSVERVSLNVLFPTGFFIRVVRLDQCGDEGRGFGCFATSPVESPARLDCLGGRLPAGGELTAHMLVTTGTKSLDNVAVVAVAQSMDSESDREDAFQRATFNVSVI